jgi:hypothetical protein
MKILCELIIEHDGKPVYKGKSKSFLQNMGKIFAVANSAPVGVDTTGTVTDTSGASKTIYGEYSYATGGGTQGGVWLGAYGLDNDDSLGIIVGSGSNPVSPTDYALASKIPHGTGTGQLDYEPSTVTSSYSSTFSYVEIARSFINKSGADIIVREVGLVGRNYWRDAAGVKTDVKCLIARDVLPAPITVKPLGSLTVRYRISLAIT